MPTYYLNGLLTINSIFHFLFPFGLGYLLKGKWQYGFLILIAFEIFENTSGVVWSIGGWTFFSPEIPMNIAADLVIGLVGLYYGSRLAYWNMNKTSRKNRRD